MKEILKKNLRDKILFKYNFLNTVNDSIFILYKYFYSNVSPIVLLCLRQKNKEKKFYKKNLRENDCIKSGFQKERVIRSSPVFRVSILLL